MATGGYARGVLCPGSDIDVDAAAPAEGPTTRRCARSPRRSGTRCGTAGIKLSPAAHSTKTLLAPRGGRSGHRDLDPARAVPRRRRRARSQRAAAGGARAVAPQADGVAAAAARTGQQRWETPGRRGVAAGARPEGRPRRSPRPRHDPLGAGGRPPRRDGGARGSGRGSRRPGGAAAGGALRAAPGHGAVRRTRCCCRTRTASPRRWGTPTPMR